MISILCCCGPKFVPLANVEPSPQTVSYSTTAYAEARRVSGGVIQYYGWTEDDDDTSSPLNTPRFFDASGEDSYALNGFRFDIKSTLDSLLAATSGAYVKFSGVLDRDGASVFANFTYGDTSSDREYALAKLDADGSVDWVLKNEDNSGYLLAGNWTTSNIGVGHSASEILWLSKFESRHITATGTVTRTLLSRFTAGTGGRVYSPGKALVSTMSPVDYSYEVWDVKTWEWYANVWSVPVPDNPPQPYHTSDRTTHAGTLTDYSDYSLVDISAGTYSPVWAPLAGVGNEDIDDVAYNGQETQVSKDELFKLSSTDIDPSQTVDDSGSFTRQLEFGQHTYTWTLDEIVHVYEETTEAAYNRPIGQPTWAPQTLIDYPRVTRVGQEAGQYLTYQRNVRIESQKRLTHQTTLVFSGGNNGSDTTINKTHNPAPPEVLLVYTDEIGIGDWDSAGDKASGVAAISSGDSHTFCDFASITTFYEDSQGSETSTPHYALGFNLYGATAYSQGFLLNGTNHSLVWWESWISEVRILGEGTTVTTTSNATITQEVATGVEQVWEWPKAYWQVNGSKRQLYVTSDPGDLPEFSYDASPGTESVKELVEHDNGYGSVYYRYGPGDMASGKPIYYTGEMHNWGCFYGSGAVKCIVLFPWQTYGTNASQTYKGVDMCFMGGTDRDSALAVWRFSDVGTTGTPNSPHGSISNDNAILSDGVYFGSDLGWTRISRDGRQIFVGFRPAATVTHNTYVSVTQRALAVEMGRYGDTTAGTAFPTNAVQGEQLTIPDPDPYASGDIDGTYGDEFS